MSTWLKPLFWFGIDVSKRSTCPNRYLSFTCLSGKANEKDVLSKFRAMPEQCFWNRNFTWDENSILLSFPAKIQNSDYPQCCLNTISSDWARRGTSKLSSAESYCARSVKVHQKYQYESCIRKIEKETFEYDKNLPLNTTVIKNRVDSERSRLPLLLWIFIPRNCPIYWVNSPFPA